MDEVIANPVMLARRAPVARAGRLTPRVRPVLRNVVATMSVGVRLDLMDLGLRARNCEYNPRRFNAAVMRIREPKTTALLFNSGKVVVTGARTEACSRRAGRKFARILRKLGYDEATFTDWKVQNMVASCNVGFKIALEGMSHSCLQSASYEPELFPGLIYRLPIPKVVFLVFSSGNVVITGAKVRGDLDKAFGILFPLIYEFKRITPPEE